jgi:hypothetical protein
MHRLALACSLIALGVASAPASGQGSQYATGALGHAVEVDNPDGGALYVTALPKPATESFEALQIAYANLKIPTTTIDPGHGVVGTVEWNVPHRLGGRELSRYFDCGSGRGQSADELTVKLTIRSSIASDSASGRSSLTTTLMATGTDPGQASSHPMQCQTTGQLETRVSDELMKTLAK